MDLWLVYRNAHEVASLLSPLPDQDVLSVRQWDIPYFGYLEVVKR